MKKNIAVLSFLFLALTTTIAQNKDAFHPKNILC